MKILILIGAGIGGLAFLFLLRLIYFGYQSQTPPPHLGVSVSGQFSPCPDSPNCVSTQSHQPEKSFPPLSYSSLFSTSLELKNHLSEVIREMGGQIVDENETYLRAEFTSSLFRFVDDLEVLIDTQNQILHLKSASRVGYSDLGVNRKRLEQLTDRLQAKGV